MKKMLKSIAIWAGVAVVLSSVLSCDSEPPTKPDQPKNYTVYIGNYNDGRFWKYEPPNGILDSFHLPVMPEYIPHISADGEQIYVNCRDSIVAVNVSTMSVSKIWGQRLGGGVFASPDNRLLAITGFGLDVVRTSDNAVVFHDSTEVGYGRFSDDSRTFYANYDDPAKMDDGVYVLKLGATPTVKRSVFDGVSARLIAPSADEKKWYIYFDINSDRSAFGVYDVATDSFPFFKYMSPGQGDMCKAPNDRYVFFTNPGTIIEGTPGTTSIFVYDTRANDIVATIDAAGQYGDDPRSYNVCLDNLTITPDSRWLVGTAWGFWGWLVVDVNTLQEVKRESLGIDHYGLGFLLCQVQE
ncbi:hypothetical protein C3F09_06250 [candidate division GN15 bacterium]|uniref:YncE family protein n=1 Tax=candidate division GN15 bacterium TaxID=2072418 RepID=A0A855X1Y6_9BACT|nr:MAG: hypothetical protein C3F09_06250 [candidate division GN15 bacterium]